MYLTDPPLFLRHTSSVAGTHEPRTLQEAILYFSDYANCHDAMVNLRWPDGVVRCPGCGSRRVTYLANAKVWKCYSGHDRPKFSLKVGTVFEDSPIPLQKWLPALWMLTNGKNGISSYKLGRALGVTQKTSWFMLHRLRLALQAEDGGVDKRARVGVKHGRRVAGKFIVIGCAHTTQP